MIVGADDERRTALSRYVGKWPVRLIKIAIILAVGWAVDEGAQWLTRMHLVDVPTLNAEIKAAVSKFSPWSMADSMSARLRDEHGWRMFSFGAPFNLRVAREQLRKYYPLVPQRAGALVDLSWLASRTPPDTAEYQRQLEEYRRARAKIDRYAFPRWVPRFVSTIVGSPDAFMFMVQRMFAGGALSIAIGLVVLVVVLSFLFTREASTLPGVVMLLPLFTTLIAWVLFLPVQLGALVLNWITIHFWGAPLQAPEAVTLGILTSVPAVNWCTRRLIEHQVAEALIKIVDT